MIEKINEAADYLKNAGFESPEIGIVLGTGLGNKFVEQIENAVAVGYDTIPHFPTSTVESHHGKLIYGKIGKKSVLVMQGRFHFYEGYSMQQITFPVRVMKILGVKNLLISNAAGNMNKDWAKGELMVLDDHINLQPDNPLVGKNIDELGPRFPDMSAPYSPKLNNLLFEIAHKKGIKLNKGVYVAVMGPNLETRAEYRFLRGIGADAVGMSTVPEVIIANHMGLPCCAISVLTDDCDPENLHPVRIEDILAIAAKAEMVLTDLYVSLIGQL